jgi:GTP cyclohydrolase IA
VEKLSQRAPRERAPVDRPRAAAAIEEFLQALGFAPERDPDLRATGRLVAAAYADELLAGYALDPAQILAESVSAGSSEIVALCDLRTTIMCPHHLLPASGVVHVAYAPAERVVGLGALSRLVECYARRLTLQEALVRNVVDALVTHLGARGAGCVAELAPACVNARSSRCGAAQALTFAAAGEMQAGQPLHAAFLALMSSRAPALAKTASTAPGGAR